MFVVSKHINNIWLNPKEYLLDKHDEIKTFKNENQAIQYLLKHGVKQSEIGYSVFIEERGK